MAFKMVGRSYFLPRLEVDPKFMVFRNLSLHGPSEYFLQQQGSPKATSPIRKTTQHLSMKIFSCKKLWILNTLFQILTLTSDFSTPSKHVNIFCPFLLYEGKSLSAVRLLRLLANFLGRLSGSDGSHLESFVSPIQDNFPVKGD